MFPVTVRSRIFRHLLLAPVVCLCLVGAARGQEAPPPAYLAMVEGAATLERDGDVVPATQNMPFVTGDRLRTANGRVQIVFPDGSAIEVAEYSEVEAVSPTRVRLIAGTMDHLQRQPMQSVSASYMPQELDTYGATLDQYGSWQYAAPYGYVWYPTVAADWRPYYYGFWSPVRSYGWTWVGADIWAWPTHHYGRWGYARDRWFWIPGRTWGPAWVSWAAAPGYVSWCPLGFDSRPVFGLSVSFGNDRWHGWTVLPRANFGVHGYYAHRNAIEPRRIAANTPFIVQNTPPVPATRTRVITGTPATAGIAVPRESPLGSRQAPIGRSQPPAGDRSSTYDRSAPAYGRAPNNQRRSPGDQQPATNGDPVAVPGARTRPAANGRQAPVPEHRPSTPDYRAPDYRVAVPRTTLPPPAYGQQAPAPEYRPSTPDNRAPDRRMAVPRTTLPPAVYGQPTPGPAYRPTIPEYRPAVPEYRSSPNDRPAAREDRQPGRDYRTQRENPRSTAPPPTAPPPAATAPSGERAPAGMAVPRTSAPGARPNAPPPQAAPQGGPPPARSQPAQQGEGRSRGEGRPAESRRPR